MKKLCITIGILAIMTNEGAAQWKGFTHFVNPGSLGIIDSILLGYKSGGDLYRYMPSLPSSWILSDTGIREGTDKGITAYGSIGPYFCVGTKSGDFYRSNDSGKHWIPTGYGLPNVLAPITSFVAIDSELYMGYDGLYRSTDSGIHWTKTSFTSSVNTFAQIGTNLFIGGGSVFLSTNSGDSWTQTSFPSSAVFGLAVSGTTIYAANNIGIYRSTDSGAHWAKVNNGLPPNYINSFVTDGKNLFLGTGLPSGSGGVGIYRSTDNGASWDIVNAGLPYLNIVGLTVFNSNLIANITFNGTSSLYIRPLSEMVDTTKSAVQEMPMPPSQLTMEAYPNPLSNAVTIAYTLPAGSPVTMVISDALGRSVAIPITNEYQEIGTHRIEFDASHLPPGIYWCRLSAGASVQVTKLVIER